MSARLVVDAVTPVGVGPLTGCAECGASVQLGRWCGGCGQLALPAPGDYGRLVVLAAARTNDTRCNSPELECSA